MLIMAIKKLTPTRLAEVAGPALAATIMERFGGRTIPRVSMFHVRRAHRDDAVRAYVDKHGFAGAAARFELSARQVRRICNGS